MGELFRHQQESMPIIGIVAGSGQIARCAVTGGADLLIVLNAGLYRTLGTGSLASFLPYGNANEQTEQLLRQHVLPRAGATPIIAGVFGADPTTDLSAYLKRLQELGVAGVTNWPSLGHLLVAHCRRRRHTWRWQMSWYSPGASPCTFKQRPVRAASRDSCIGQYDRHGAGPAPLLHPRR